MPPFVDYDESGKGLKRVRLLHLLAQEEKEEKKGFEPFFAFEFCLHFHFRSALFLLF